VTIPANVHPRVTLHQVAFPEGDTAAFVRFCDAQGIAGCTLITPKLDDDAVGAARAAVVRTACLTHPFALAPDLERDAGAAARGLLAAIARAEALECPAIYMVTGGRGRLSWEEAAERFAELLAPCREAAEAKGVRLMAENASALNADIHIAHTLPDVTRLAEIAGIGVCIDLHACWMEGALRENLGRAMPLTGLVQVSDYVPGDRTTPCRAVPGDGAIPLEAILRDVLDLGYDGPFDLELVGPRIAAEGPEAASVRAAHNLSRMLDKLGA
jgi:sugar phosphate isomerase/epimerase